MIDFKLALQCRIFQYQIMAPQQENIPVHCAGEHPFQLASKAPSADYKSFIEGEARSSSLKRSFPDKADQLFDRAAKIASDRYEHLTKLSKLYE